MDLVVEIVSEILDEQRGLFEKIYVVLVDSTILGFVINVSRRLKILKTDFLLLIIH